MWAAPEDAAKLVEVYAQGRRQFWSWNLAHANLEGGDLMDVDLRGSVSRGLTCVGPGWNTPGRQETLRQRIEQVARTHAGQGWDSVGLRSSILPTQCKPTLG